MCEGGQEAFKWVVEDMEKQNILKYKGKYSVDR